MKLVVPAAEHLASYVGALERAWSPDNLRGKAAAEEQLAWIARDALILRRGRGGERHRHSASPRTVRTV